MLALGSVTCGCPKFSLKHANFQVNLTAQPQVPASGAWVPFTDGFVNGGFVILLD
jgi:hypothetical protein